MFIVYKMLVHKLYLYNEYKYVISCTVYPQNNMGATVENLPATLQSIICIPNFEFTDSSNHRSCSTVVFIEKPYK